MAVKDVGVLVRRPGEAVCRSERRFSGEKGVGVEVVGGRKVGWVEAGVGGHGCSRVGLLVVSCSQLSRVRQFLFMGSSRHTGRVSANSGAIVGQRGCE